MGRYYNGDINGKFWFAIQASDDASFFGGEVLEPNTIEYGFVEDDLDSIKEGLSKCSKALGENEKKLDTYFEENNGYNDRELSKYLEVTEEKLNGLLKWYARKELGQKILECVEEQGSCYFDAEL